MTERRIETTFTTRTSCLIVPAEIGERSPLLVALHGQGQSGERHRAWLKGAVPATFAAAYPDGFHTHEVRATGKPIRLGHAWYLFTGDQEAFAKSLQESEAALWPLIDKAVDRLGADPQRVYLCGFSQGAYLTHCAAVRAADRVAGWIAQAGRLKAEFLGPWKETVAGKPVLIQQGRHDTSLPEGAAESSAAWLREAGADVTLKTYDADHRITEEMRSDLREWLEAR